MELIKNLKEVSLVKKLPSVGATTLIFFEVYDDPTGLT